MGIHKGKMKVALNEKRKKLHGFSFSINIANFEAFLLVFKLTKNLFFLKSATLHLEKVTEATLHLEKVTEAMAKFSLSLEYLKVTEATTTTTTTTNNSKNNNND